MTAKLDKIKFPKQSELLDLGVDLGMEGYDGVVFRFWSNPSRMVVQALWDMVMIEPEKAGKMTEAQVDEMEAAYYVAISELMLDNNIEGLTLDTPEAAKEAFYKSNLPMGFLHMVGTSYLSHMIEFNESVKKALALYVHVSSSGSDESKKESESTPESSETQKKN